MLCLCSALLFLHDGRDLQRSLLRPAEALSLAGLLTQLAFHRGIPRHFPEAISFMVS